MKKLALLSIFAISAILSHAQTTSLLENFNVCDSTAEGWAPPGWYVYNVLGTQTWQHYGLYGVGGSPCMEMNGYLSGTGDMPNEDWLITPQLTLSSYSTIYLHFFSTYKYAGDSLHIMYSNNYTGSGNPDSSVFTWAELTHGPSMMYDTAFAEFQVNLTPYKSSPLYVGFKYTSDTASASRWNLDSVFTASYPLTVATVNNNVQLPLTVIGNSSSNNINLLFDVNAGLYNIEVYDLLGRRVFFNAINATQGEQTYNVTNLNLSKGVYIVKLGNENSSGFAKASIQ